MKTLVRCTLCPRECGADRENEKGFCNEGWEFRIGRIAPHLWEEPSISGENGSGAIFFAGCNLRCVYCQNRVLSCGEAGQRYGKDELTEALLRLQKEGVHNINLVTPTHYALPIAEVLREARAKGLVIPVVYNTSGYEKVESLMLLEGLVDIYMPDLKYLSSELAKKYSHASDYPDVVKKAIEEMYRQVGEPVFDKDGIMQKGVLVRHLVLPEQTEEGKKVIKYLYETYGDNIIISIMNQYTPVGDLKNFPELQRTLREDEYEEVVDYAISIGVENGYIQEGETARESFIPDFK